MALEGANTAGVAGLPSGDDTSTATSSIIPGDDYASGGPEPSETPENAVDFGSYDFEEAEESAPEEPEKPEPADTGEGQEQPEAPEVPDSVKKEQSPEANAAFAEMRRKAEEAEQALKARDAWVEKKFGQSHGLKTWEQYQSAVEHTHKQQQEARRQAMQQQPQQVFQQTYRDLIAQSYDETVAREIANSRASMVAQNLQMQAVQEELAAIKQREQERQAALQQQMQQQQQQAVVQQKTQEILTDHDKLRKEYGELVPADLNQVDKATIDKVYRGYSLYDAWYTTNKAKVVEQAQKAASQKTLNNLSSKSHLKTEGDGAGDSNASTIPLPTDTLQMYLDSGMTEKQARAFHKKLYG